MADLEDKLRDILNSSKSGYCAPDCERGINGFDEDIKDLKQAFTDEGYLKHPVSKDNLLADKQLMTGQAWYSRFEKELERSPEYNLTPGNRSEGSVIYYKKTVLEAARRAAGISE